MKRLSFAALVVLAGLLTGCAAGRSTIDIPQAPTATATTGKAFVKIVEVRDLRRFEAAPKNPSTPSLQNPEEIKNPAITARAVARKRGGYGNALGDIVLPEQRTVPQVVREAVTRALNEQGYVVVQAGAPQFDQALPLQVDIDQFWAWFNPGFAQVSVEFRGLLILKGEALTGRKEDIVNGTAIVTGMAATEDDWRKVLVAGVNDLIKNMRAVFRPASQAP